jgi:transposase-like protein
MAKRKFTAEFKARLVLEALKEERQIGFSKQLLSNL